MPPGYPGVFTEEQSNGGRIIRPAPTSITAFVGRTAEGPVNTCVEVKSFVEFERGFGGLSENFPLAGAVGDFFRNGGMHAVIVRLLESDSEPALPLTTATYRGDPAAKTGLHALDQIALFNILCIPPDTTDGDTPPDVYRAAAGYCVTRRAMLIIDPPRQWQDKFERGAIGEITLSDLGPYPAEAARSAAVYFPRALEPDLLVAGQHRSLPASGAIAGIWAATDAARGVWKAPAGTGAVLKGVVGLEANLTDAQQEPLNRQGINSLRNFFSLGPLVWGARTLRGAGEFADEYKYIPVRRTALFIETSILAGIQWVVFEPNGAPLWAELYVRVTTFMTDLFRQGAFPAAVPREAFFITCDATTTTQSDIDAGFVNIQVGFAPLKPAEFIVLTLRQIAKKPDPD